MSTIRYKVTSYDNFDPYEECAGDDEGTFSTYEEAVAYAKLIVDRSLRWERSQASDQTDPIELYERYTDFGDDPAVVPEPSGQHFSAWQYAEMRCCDICREPPIEKSKLGL